MENKHFMKTKKHSMKRNEDVENFEAGLSSENGGSIEEPQTYQDMGIHWNGPNKQGEPGGIE